MKKFHCCRKFQRIQLQVKSKTLLVQIAILLRNRSTIVDKYVFFSFLYKLCNCILETLSYLIFTKQASKDIIEGKCNVILKFCIVLIFSNIFNIFNINSSNILIFFVQALRQLLLKSSCGRKILMQTRLTASDRNKISHLIIDTLLCKSMKYVSFYKIVYVYVKNCICMFFITLIFLLY